MISRLLIIYEAVLSRITTIGVTDIYVSKSSEAEEKLK
jgi:hypothetical protein